MAASPSCNSPLGSVAIAKSGRTEHLQQRASPAADTSTLQFSPLKPFHGAEDVIRTALISSNSNQACRLASFAVAATATATAWVGLSMWPLEALAMVYVTADHQTVGESSSAMSTFSGPLANTSGEFVDNASIHNLNSVMPDMETQVGNVPSIKPPNEGLNSPWVPKINGLKNNNESKRRMVRCPPWTMSELQMVLPDLQGKPKPFPRMQGQVYPFWPATVVGREDGEDDDNNGNKQELINPLVVAQAASLTLMDGVHNTHDRKTNLPPPPPPPPPPQQDQMAPMKKARSCFTM